MKEQREQSKLLTELYMSTKKERKSSVCSIQYHINTFLDPYESNGNVHEIMLNTYIVFHIVINER